MKIEYENLEQIPEIKTLLQEVLIKLESQVESQWLSVKQLMLYIDYGKSTIYKKIETKEFLENVHYYRNGTKIFFNKYEIDNWVKGVSQVNRNDFRSNESLINDLLCIS